MTSNIRTRLAVSSLLLCACLAASTHAQVAELQPRIFRPGETTKLTLTGKELDKSLRLITSRVGIATKIESATAEQAIVELSVPADAVPGPMGLWTATHSTTSDPWIVIVDDLPATPRDANNTSRQTAQQITTQTAIAATSRGALSDFYRFQVEAGKTLSFEIHTQSLHSPMDPLLKLTTLEGQLLKSADEDGASPDVRFSYRFEQAGDFILEVLDSRYAAGGSYHLRIGDFPVLASAQPMALQRGQSAKLQFQTIDGTATEEREVAVPVDSLDSTLYVATKRAGGSSSAWLPIRVADVPIHPNGVANTQALILPVGISGCLKEKGTVDTYLLQGIKDQTMRFSSFTRSLGSPALLKMQLLNAAGAKVAETAIAKDDEWFFDYKFTDDAAYTLKVTDLLGRCGTQFGYFVEVKPVEPFSLALKGDAKTLSRFLMDAVRGCAAIPLNVKRTGYEGEIELELTAHPSEATKLTGLKILNPTIPAGAKEARVLITVSEGWSAEQLSSLQLIGRSKAQPAHVSQTTQLDIQRLQKPFIPYPQSWSSSRFVLAGKAAIDPLFALDDQAPLKLARYLPEQPATMTLKRINAEFKAGVTVLTEKLPAGFAANVKADKDSFATTITRTEPNNAANEFSDVEFLLYAEHAGQGFLQLAKMPIQWFDPLKVRLDLPKTIIAGSTITATISVERAIAAQPITVSWQNVPVGVQLPEKVVIAADQTSATFDLILSKDFPSGPLQLNMLVSSKASEKDFSFATSSTSGSVIPSPVSVQAFPPSIALDSGKAKRQLVITGLDATNTPSDWTSLAQLVSLNPAIAEVQGTVVYPKSDGETQIRVRVGGIEHLIPIKVSNHANLPRTDFESEVLVALSKQGCNAGACHGSPSGKGMFRLSLRAFDQKLDELTLIREDFGRRINTVEPEQSLLLLKPLMKVGHGGGKQIRKEDVAYKVLTNWIREGGKADPAGVARCVRLEVFPNERRTLAATGGSQQLAVIAHFGDGSQRDVTELCAYESSNQQVAAIDANGRVSAKSRGEAVVLVRFLEHIESVRLMCIDPNSQFQWQSPTPNNFVDQMVYEKLRSMQYLPADVCSDSEFLRRAHLDVIGVLPTVDETRSFLGDASPDKRAKLVDALLARPEYAKFWALKWGDLLKLTNKLVGNDAVYKYHRWLEDAISSDMPYDQFARQLITASGSTLANPPANFYRTATDMNECVETISQVFIGARLQCAKCHNHPFERWTQDNYYGLAAFFNRVGRRETLRPGEMFIYAGDSGEVTQPRTGQQMKPWLPSQGSIDPPADRDRRELFADWLIQSGNPYFAKIGANRIWSHLFSRGIIDPVDDFRDSNPPVNEPLLDALAQDFQEHQYSTKHLLRTILNSKTYQAAYQPTAANRDDTLYFSHQQPRLLKAEQLLDAVNHVTGIAQVFGSLPADWKATHLPAPDLVKVDFLKVFGQPERSTVCACERSSDSNLAMAIELFNGPLIHERLRDPNNRFRKALAAGATQEAVLDELYLAALCRLPNETERNAAIAHLKRREDIAAGFEDVCWAIINTDEFLFQH